MEMHNLLYEIENAWFNSIYPMKIFDENESWKNYIKMLDENALWKWLMKTHMFLVVYYYQSNVQTVCT